MGLTKVQLAQAIREALYTSQTYVLRKSGTYDETEPSRKQCERAITGEVHRLLQKLDPEIEAPDITSPTEVNRFIEELSRRNFAVGYVT